MRLPIRYLNAFAEYMHDTEKREAEEIAKLKR